MFRSKERQINFPQSEHGRLAGQIAALWGNRDFDVPPVNYESFVSGVALHDRGYGFVDPWGIGDSPEHEWLELTRKGFEMQYNDAVADLIVRYHLRRLVRTNHAVAGRALLQEMDASITAQLEANGFSADLFEHIDRITNFCDMLSFDFCFDTPTEGERIVKPHFDRNPEANLHYEIRPNAIRFAPWTLSVPEYSTFVIAYQRDGYPQRLEPLIVPVKISPM